MCFNSGNEFRETKFDTLGDEAALCPLGDLLRIGENLPYLIGGAERVCGVSAFFCLERSKRSFCYHVFDGKLVNRFTQEDNCLPVLLGAEFVSFLGKSHEFMPKNKSNQTESKMKKQTVAWRTKPKVLELLEEAQRVSGSDRTELIEKCIEDAIERVVKNEVTLKAEEAKRAQEALKTYRPHS